MLENYGAAIDEINLNNMRAERAVAEIKVILTVRRVPCAGFKTDYANLACRSEKKKRRTTMKKRIKNKAIAILIFLCAMFMSFSFVGNTAAFADSDKETEFVSNVNSFVAMADSDSNGSLSDAEIRAVMGSGDRITVGESELTADGLFLAMYNFVNNDDTATEHIVGYEEAKTVYSLIIAQYDLNGAVQLYSTLATTIRNIHLLQGASYKDHLKVEAARAKVDELSGAGYEQDMAFLKNVDLDLVGGDFEDLVNAEAKITAWKEDIEHAIAAIKAVKVYVVADGAMEAVFDGSEYRNAADYKVYLASENTVNAAKSNRSKTRLPSFPR